MLKQKLTQIIIDQIDNGRFLSDQSVSVAKIDDLDKLLLNYNKWDEENKHLLKNGFTQPYQQFIRMYSGTTYLPNQYLEANSFEVKRGQLLYSLPKQMANLQITLDSIEQLPHTALLPFEPLQKLNFNPIKEKSMKKIFISHSSLDSGIVTPFKDLLEVIGIDSDEIFYSSHPDYGVGLGENILERLKTELNKEILVFFIFSDNFFNSPVCLCEMGATWIKTNQQISFLIPPFNFDKVKGVFPNFLGMQINDKSQLNHLKETLAKKYNLKPISSNKWEEKRDKYLLEINDLIKNSKAETERKEKEILSKISVASDGRIKRSDLKAIIDREPEDRFSVGKTKLRRVYLSNDFQLDN